METPDTKAGEMTEAIMAKVRARWPDIPTHRYNPIYSSVLEVLEGYIIEEPVGREALNRRLEGFVGRDSRPDRIAQQMVERAFGKP